MDLKDPKYVKKITRVWQNNRTKNEGWVVWWKTKTKKYLINGGKAPFVILYSRRSQFTTGGAVFTVGGAKFTVGGAVFTEGGAQFTVGGAVFTIGGAEFIVQGNSEKCTGAFKFGCRMIFWSIHLSKSCRKSLFSLFIYRIDTKKIILCFNFISNINICL